MKLQTKQRIDHYLGGVLVFFLRPLVFLLGRVLRRDHHLTPRKSLYFIKMVGGGSLVIAYPALLGLRRRYPEHEFVIVTTPAVQPFAERLGIFDRMLILDDRSVLAAVRTTVATWLDSLQADTYVDLEVYSRLTTVASTLSLARNRIGFFLETYFWRKHIHTHLIYFNRFAGAHLFYEQIARLLGAAIATTDDCEHALRENLDIRKSTPDGVVLVGIGHTCSELGQERMLSEEQWLAVLAEKFKPEFTYELHFFGVEQDHALASRIIARAETEFPRIRFRNHCGRLSLKESVEALAVCDEFWGIDSALLHFARTLRLRCTSFWGPTHPRTRLKPDPVLDEEVRYQPVVCSPCIHVAETPPCKGNNVCITALFSAPGTNEAEPESPTWTPADS